jgi:hypothetical protein
MIVTLIILIIYTIGTFGLYRDKIEEQKLQITLLNLKLENLEKELEAERIRININKNNIYTIDCLTVDYIKEFQDIKAYCINFVNENNNGALGCHIATIRRDIDKFLAEIYNTKKDLKILKDKINNDNKGVK